MFNFYINGKMIKTINGTESFYDAYYLLKDFASATNSLIEVTDSITGEMVISYNGEFDEEMEF